MFELAKHLFKAGLKWEPKAGDWFLHEDETKHLMGGEYYGGFNLEDGTFIWLPSLSQLLEEIKNAGFKDFNLRYLGSDWCISLNYTVFLGKTPEEAASKALLRILENKSHNPDLVMMPDTMVSCVDCIFLWPSTDGKPYCVYSMECYMGEDFEYKNEKAFHERYCYIPRWDADEKP